MTLPSLVGAVDGWSDNRPDARWWRTTSGPDRRQPDVARRTVRSRGARARPGLDQALAAVRSGDTLVARGIKLSLGGTTDALPTA